MNEGTKNQAAALPNQPGLRRSPLNCSNVRSDKGHRRISETEYVLALTALTRVLAAMRRLFLPMLIAFFFLLGSNFVLGQTENPKAALFDSYGTIGYEDLSARLDSFAIQLQNLPDAIGYVVAYGPEGERSGTGEAMLRVQKNYLTNSRGIDEERLQTIYAGRYKDPTEALIQLWVVPGGASPPQPRRYDSKPKTIKGKFSEFDGYDDLAVDEVGPLLGSVTFAALADVLRQQPRDLAYIVAFNSRGAAPGTWRRVAKRDAADLQERGIETDRIKIIFGGTAKSKQNEDEYPKHASIQLWVLPVDAPPPVKEAKAEPAPKEAVQIGSYSDYQLKSPPDERWVFEGFADMLRANEAVSICIIVRPRTPAAGQEDLPLAPAEPPDIDPLKLVEKWKAELTGKLGVKESRIIVLPATADETNEGTVEVWVVPTGAALPNPYAHPDDSNLEDSQ